MGTKLNLASGTALFEGNGWLNLDVVPKWPSADKGCDIVWDARKDKLPFGDNSVEEVYAGFLLLHLTRRHHIPVLSEIYRVLAPGAIFRIVEVDMPVVMQRFIAEPFNPQLSDLIWGEQGSFHGDPLEEFDKHCQGHTRESLQALLSDSGFGSFEYGVNSNPDVFWEFHIKCHRH